jgi:hypothetical protein
LILKRLWLPISLRQQQLSGSNLAFFSARTNLCYIVSVVYWSEWLYIWTNWYKIQLFFRVLQWFCLTSNLSQTHFRGPQHCEDTRPIYSYLTNICFGPSHHLKKFRHSIFLHPAYKINF